MFNNSSHIDASHSTFSEVHRDQYFTSRTNVQGNQTVNTFVHGNQILQSSQIGLEALQKASATSAVFDSAKRLAASFFFFRRDIERRTTRHFFPTIATQFLSSIPAIRPDILAALEQDCMIPFKVLRGCRVHRTYPRDRVFRALKRSMCGIDDPSKLNRDVEDLQERRQAAYDEALFKTLLYWIETASIFDDIDKAILMLRDALNWLKSLASIPKETSTLIEDAERLVLLYRHPISQSAPHVYHTAITFGPSSSALYANFKHDAGGSCTIHQGQDDEWQAYQHAIDVGSVTSVAFSPSGSVVATAGSRGPTVECRYRRERGQLGRQNVICLDPNLGREYFKDLGVHTHAITCLEFSPNSSLLASGARDQMIQLWSLMRARLQCSPLRQTPSVCITTLDVSRDGNMVVTGSQDKSVKVWDVRSGGCTRTLSKGHKGVIRSPRTEQSSDASIWDWGKNLRSTLGNAPVWQWKVIERGLPAFLLRKMTEMTLDGIASQELLLTYSSQSSSFAFSYLSETWCAQFGLKVETPAIHVSRAFLSALALSPDGTRVAAGTYSGSLDILDTTVSVREWDEEMKREHGVPLRFAHAVVASPNGARFLANSGLTWYLTDDNFQFLSKVDFGTADYSRTDDVQNPVFSADSSTFAWSMSDIWERQNKTTVRVYESTTGTQKVRFFGLKKVQAFVVSPDGNFIGCGHEGSITVCDVGEEVKRAMNVEADTSITALDFSSDSKTLSSGSEKGVLQLWDSSSGACKATIAHEEFNSPATAVGFAPLGDMAVIAHKDGTVRFVSFSTSASHAVSPRGTSFTRTVREVQFFQDPFRLVCRTDMYPFGLYPRSSFLPEKASRTTRLAPFVTDKREPIHRNPKRTTPRNFCPV
ncbi:WD40 repeat-like protein [Imleria badia]|nr:WD40 repeat-like protein [Imleria badia]